MLASNRPNYEDIKRSTAGIIFLGTPHGGTEIADYAAFIAKLKRNDPSLVESLSQAIKICMNYHLTLQSDTRIYA